MVGQKYALTDIERPPRHPLCRCTVIPVVNPALLADPDARPAYDFGEWLESEGIATVSQEFAEAA